MVTIDVKQLLIGLLLLAAVVLIVFLIIAVSHLITTLKKVNGILDDTSAVTTIVHEKADETKPLVDELSGAVMSFASAMKGNESSIASLSSISKALSSMVSVIKNSKK